MAAQDSPFQQNQQGSTPVNQVPPSIVPPPTIPPANPGSTEQAQPSSPQPAQTQTTTPPAPKKGFPKVLKVLGVVLLLIVLTVAVYKFIVPMFGGGTSSEITWWGLWEDETIVAPLIAEYEEKTGVKVNYVKQSQQDYRERLTNALAKGEGPDIFRFHNSWVPMLKQELDTIPASVMSTADFSQTFYTVASSDLALGSGFAGIPLEYDAITLFINEDIFSSGGKTAPTTWDDLRQTAIELTTKDEREVITQAGVALGRTENVDHWQEILGLMMLQNGASLSRPTGPLAEDALSFYTVFSGVDGVWDETLPPSTISFASGKVAMYFAPSWRAFEISQQNPNLNFKTYPVPQLPKASDSEPDITYATYWVEGVWARSENKETAWDFLKFISEKSSLEKLYQNASKVRSFGEPYPRRDMASLLSNHPVLGSIISLAPDADSWYLASRTFDGPTGINSQLSSYFEDAINAINGGTAPAKALETASQGVSQVLTQYGVINQ